jgi:threonine 3-dehydrogenase
MKAVVKSQPLPRQLAIDEIETPRPPNGWLLVDIELSGICGSDLHTYHWTPDYQIRFRNKLPRVIGHEFTAHVREVGEGVTGWAAGDRLVARTPIHCGECHPCLTGRESLCNSRRLLGVDYDGTMAESAILPASNCFHISQTISPLLAALSEPISIAYSAVLKTGSLLGRTVAIIGPGPIGYLIALLASLSGAARVAVLGLPKDRDRLTHLGRNIDRSETFDDVRKFQEVLSAPSYSSGADVIFEVTGSAKGVQFALESVAKLGQVVLVGIVSDTVSLNTNLAVRSELLLVGSAAAPKSIWMRMLNHLAQLSQGEQEKFEQVVTHRFPLSQALSAFELMDSGVGLKMMLTSVED